MALREASAGILLAAGAKTSNKLAGSGSADQSKSTDLKALEHGAQALLAAIQPSQHDVPIVEKTQEQLNRELREFLNGRCDDEQFAQAQLHFAKYGLNLTDADRRLAAIVSQYEAVRNNQLYAAAGESEWASREVDRRPVSFENATAIFKRNLESTLQSVWDSSMRRVEHETVYELANAAQSDWETSARRILNAIAVDSFTNSSTRLRDASSAQSVEDSPKYGVLSPAESRLAEIVRTINNEAVLRGANSEAARSTFNMQAAFTLIDALGDSPITNPRPAGEPNAQTAFANRQLAEAVTLCRTLTRELLSSPAVRDDLVRDAITSGEPQPAKPKNAASSAEVAVPGERANATLAYRTSARFERSFRLVALRTLEDNYATYVRACVFADADTVRAAQLGGVPSTRALIRAFIQIRLRHFLSRLPTSHGWSGTSTSTSGNAAQDGPFEDGMVDGQPVWMVLYALTRVGAYREAAELARTHFSESRFVELGTLITELGESRSLSAASRERVVAVYNAAASSRRLSAQLNTSRFDTELGSTTRDPFKRFMLSLFGAVNLEEQHSEVADTIEDHIWMRLTQIGVLDSADSPNRSLSLDAFQILLSNQLGESYFGAHENPLLFFRVLMLTAQFEMACAFLTRFEHLKALGVHLAIALRSAGLLVITEPDVHVTLLTAVRGSALKRLNYARLILTYAKRFERSDARCAVEYYFLLRDLQLPTAESQVTSVFVQTVAELVLETHQFDLIVGRIQQGTNVRSPGLLDRFAASATDSVIGEIASHAEQSGRIEDAILLFDLARDHDSVVALLVRALSEALAIGCRSSLREREETESTSDATNAERRRVVRLAVEIAQRYSAQTITTDRTLTHTFYMLIDLHTFYEQFLTGNYELAYNTISALEILPTTNEQIDMRVAQFRTFADELQCIIPDVLLSCMLLLYRRARALRASLSGAATSVQQAALAHAHAGGIVDSVRRIQSEATVLFKFAGSLLPFRLSHDVTSRLDQLEMRITSLLD